MFVFVCQVGGGNGETNVWHWTQFDCLVCMMDMIVGTNMLLVGMNCVVTDSEKAAYDGKFDMIQTVDT